MKEISKLKGFKVLSKKEQNEINGSNTIRPFCRGSRCYISLPNGVDAFVGFCRFGNCIYA